jgi:SnoaL-like domain
MTEQSTPVAIARAFTEAWSSHDMDTAASYLADGVTFDGPTGHSTGKTAYLQGLSGFAQRVSGMKMLAALGDDTQALIMYEVATPAGTTTCAEHLTFRGGKIQTDRLTFSVGAAPTA